MNDRSCLSIILAAGEGTRMKSAMPKVLHKVAGLPMAAHVARTAVAAGSSEIALVTGREGDAVLASVTPFAPSAKRFEQTERLGTAHAVLAARVAISRGYDDILILFGDAPLVEAANLEAIRARLQDGAAVAAMGFRTDNPAGYGRMIERNGQLLAVREDRDCSEDEKKITFCNGGLIGVSGEHALSLIDRIDNKNAKNEYYLTAIVEIAHAAGLSVVATEAPEDNVLGVNNRAELARADAIWQSRKRNATMISGATLIAPETVYFSYDTGIGQDVVIEPNVFFGPGVSVGDGATIHGFSHLEGAAVGPNATVGPFARLRPGAELAEKAKVGNFCEVKKARIGEGAKVNHLTYIGDATIGNAANIGAGTITCNYDGVSKHLTEIGAGAFVGSNTSLVAPLKIGEGAYIASGSVITKDVPDDALAFGRARQANREDGASKLRERAAAARKNPA